MNVILDIDETFVQYVGTDDWKEGVPEADKPKYKIDKANATGMFILRPHFVEFFEFLFKNCKTVNLWTLSDADYASGVARLIKRLVPKANIANVWSEDDAEQASNDYGGRKNIRWIRSEHDHLFQPFNTILIDDLPANTQNQQNIRNGIQIRPFNPVGEALPRDQRKPGTIRDRHYTDLTQDDTLKKVMEKVKEIIEKPVFEGSTKINVGGSEAPKPPKKEEEEKEKESEKGPAEGGRRRTRRARGIRGKTSRR
jgi:hypothetical protein